MPQSKTPWEQASEWFARTIAIVLVMIAPGALGAWLDKQMGTNFITAIGFAAGMVLAITLLMVFVRIKPVANDGAIMTQRRDDLGSSQKSVPAAGPVKPSEMSLPEVPGVEVLERRDE